MSFQIPVEFVRRVYCRVRRVKAGIFPHLIKPPRHMGLGGAGAEVFNNHEEVWHESYRRWSRFGKVSAIRPTGGILNVNGNAWTCTLPSFSRSVSARNGRPAIMSGWLRSSLLTCLEWKT